MNPLPTGYVLVALVVGALWGAIGLALAGQMLGPPSGAASLRHSLLGRADVGGTAFLPRH